MRHAIGWADLKGSRVGVFGVGVEGRATLRRLGTLGIDAVLVDDDPSASLEGRVILATDDGGLEALARCDVIIKSPGISRYRPDVIGLEDSGVAVVGGVGLTIHDADRSSVVCVTGTKGKSTTSSLLGHLLSGLGVRSEVTGNLGRPPFDPDVPGDLDLLVIETSSFQACDVADAPGLVAVTSLAVDHVDWHGSAERYVADKLSLTSLPEAGITIAQGRSAPLRASSELLGGDVRWVEDLAGSWAEPLGLVGTHNLANAEVARAVLVALGIEGAEDDEALRAAAVGFEELPGRLNLVATHGGVSFVDDSLATNVLPTMAALDSFPHQRLALLLGGHDRGVDYTDLIEALARRAAPTLVLGLPASGPRLVEAIAARSATTETAAVSSVAEAVGAGAAWVGDDGVVLLSPAAPSFSQFASWKERSTAFRAAVAALSDEPPPPGRQS